MAPSAHPDTVLCDIHQRQRADGPAAILAIGVAYPTNCIHQDDFTDWFFRVTKSDHLTELKAKMKKICAKSGVKKRHFCHTEEMIGSHPEIIDRAAPSLGARQGIAADAAHSLAAAAVSRAIAAWGRPAAAVTHLVVCTNAGVHEPGADLRLAGLLGLPPAVRRTLLYLHGCSAGVAALRVAKDIAENNRGSRVLVACTQANILMFCAPENAHIDHLVAMALFGDGAGAVVVGADPAGPGGERPVFHMVSASQTTLPGTEHAVVMNLTESGLTSSRLSVEVPRLVQGSIERCLVGTLAPLGLRPDAGGWNGLFWAVHPGGRAILDTYEAALGLEPGKLAASRHVLREYGNMSGATVIFVLDEIRRRRQDGSSDKEGNKDCEWGVMSGLGPGLTTETVVLHMPPAGSQDEKY